MDSPLLDFLKVYCHSFASKHIRLKFSYELYTKNSQANELNYKILRWNASTFSHELAESNVGHPDVDIVIEFVAATRIVRIRSTSRNNLLNWDLYDFNHLFLLGELLGLSATEVKALENQAVINN